MNIVVISHSMVDQTSRARWIVLAQRYPDVDVTLILPKRWPIPWTDNNTPDTAKPKELNNYHVRTLATFRPGDRARFLLVGLGRTFRELNPTVLFINQEPVTAIFTQALLCRRFFAPSARIIFISSDSVVRRWRRTRLLWMHWIVNREIDASLAVNDQVREVLYEQGIRKPIHIQTAVGVHEQLFCPGSGERLRQKLGMQGFVVGYVGRLIAAKGVMDLLHAFSQLTEPKSLLIVGDGPMAEEIKLKADCLQLACQVYHIGKVPRHEMPDYLRAMDVLVLPSRPTPTWKEQFGLVLAEAMMCGIPVIGSNTGGIPETVGDAGMLFPGGDVEALSKVLIQIQDDEMLRKALANRGRQRALLKFSTTALADHTYELMNSLIEE